MGYVWLFHVLPIWYHVLRNHMGPLRFINMIPIFIYWFPISSPYGPHMELFVGSKHRWQKPAAVSINYWMHDWNFSINHGYKYHYFLIFLSLASMISFSFTGAHFPSFLRCGFWCMTKNFSSVQMTLWTKSSCCSKGHSQNWSRCRCANREIWCSVLNWEERAFRKKVLNFTFLVLVLLVFVLIFFFGVTDALSSNCLFTLAKWYSSHYSEALPFILKFLLTFVGEGVFWSSVNIFK